VVKKEKINTIGMVVNVTIVVKFVMSNMTGVVIVRNVPFAAKKGL